VTPLNTLECPLANAHMQNTETETNHCPIQFTIGTKTVLHQILQIQ
jgi:hypothetical protein